MCPANFRLKYIILLLFCYSVHSPRCLMKRTDHVISDIVSPVMYMVLYSLTGISENKYILTLRYTLN